MADIFSFSKKGFLSDSEIEALYIKKAESVKDKVIQDKLFRALMYDPRKSDIFFGSEEDAHKAEQIALKLHSMDQVAFLESDYPHFWLNELSGARIYKIANKEMLSPS